MRLLLFFLSFSFLIKNALALEAINKPFDDTYKNAFGLGFKMDCSQSHWSHASGEDPGCLQISGLRISFAERFHKRMQAHAVFNPWASPDAGLENTPPSFWRPEVRQLPASLIEEFQFLWEASPSSTIAVETFKGSTALPYVSKILTRSQNFFDSGWRQLAIVNRFEFSNFFDTHFQIALGNGEGKIHAGGTPQKYAGFESDHEVTSGLRLKFGISVDQNSAQSEQLSWLADRYYSSCGLEKSSWQFQKGYSTKRTLLSLYSPGNLNLRGLEFALNIQRNTAVDLNKNEDGFPSSDLLCSQADLRSFFYEDPTHEEANTLTRTQWGGVMSYWLLDTVALSFDVQKKTTHSDLPAFKTTKSLEAVNMVTETAYSIGVGYRLDYGLLLSLDYHKSAFDQDYEAFHFKTSRTPRKSLSLLTARLQYNWL